MEEDLIDLEKELNELDNRDDGWESLKKWEKNFLMFIEVNKSKYNWCKDEFEDIQSRKGNGLRGDDDWCIPPKNSVKGRIDSFKQLFEKIKSK